MQNIVSQVVNGLLRNIEIVSWSDILDRAFRPLIKSNTLMAQPIRVDRFDPRIRR